MVYGHLLFLLIFQQKALHPTFRLFRPARSDAEVALVQFPVPYLLVDDPQRLGILSGDDDAAGIAVDTVAQCRRKGIFPLGVPLPFLVQICLDVVDEGIHLFRLVGVDHHSLRLVRQQQVLILVHHRQVRLEQRQKQIFL